jgi:anti-anti-sigma regulatory factor
MDVTEMRRMDVTEMRRSRMSESFVVEVAPRTEEFVLRPIGSLDEAAMSVFDRAIDASIDVEPEQIAVDLRCVTSLDLDGLSSLLRARIVAAAREVPLRFSAPSAACRRVIDGGSLSGLFGLDTS